MIFDCTMCPSESKFRLITKDLGRFREVLSFALSRRQHGFEPRWGHKIKPFLTRANTSHLWVRTRSHPESRERAGSDCAAAGLDVVARSAAVATLLRWRSVSRTATEARPRRLQWLQSEPAALARKRKVVDANSAYGIGPAATRSCETPNAGSSVRPLRVRQPHQTDAGRSRSARVRRPPIS